MKFQRHSLCGSLLIEASFFGLYYMGCVPKQELILSHIVLATLKESTFLETSLI